MTTPREEQPEGKCRGLSIQCNQCGMTVSAADLCLHRRADEKPERDPAAAIGQIRPSGLIVCLLCPGTPTLQTVKETLARIEMFRDDPTFYDFDLFMRHWQRIHARKLEDSK